ncbi:MAG TPA: peptide ABC transporter substrate-binding protein [Gemmatimonadales bacterium]|nr:peptide ABC transporter substrate-binding protein [Gemmatimonadales bacterium]
MRRLAPLALIVAVACTSRGGGSCHGEHCGTVVFAAIGQPATLLPPVTDHFLDRDIFDQIFLKLADVGPGLNTVGDSGFEPQLADRWTWRDSLTLAFHLDPRARWQDGRPVTAGDVAFTFAAYSDSVLDAPEHINLAHIASVAAPDSATAVFRFRQRYPEMFFDAVYYLRILPAHLLRSLPLRQWRSAAFGRSPIGDGPYRFVRWDPGQSLELEADSTFFLGRPHVRRLIWRFASDLSVAVTQVIAGEADAIEVLVSPANVARARQATQLALYPYPGSAYLFVLLNLRARDGSGPNPILGDVAVRRALVAATDRVRMAQSVFGAAAKVPPVPIPEFWAGLWFPDLPVPPYDTALADRLLEQRGWRLGSDGVRHRGGRKLAIALAVPSTSPARRQYAQLIQEELRAVGVEVKLDLMDNVTLEDRVRRGAYDAAIQAWANGPRPSFDLTPMWVAGGGQNYAHYTNPAFDRWIEAATTARAPAAALRAWRAALGVLAADAPAIALAAPDNVAAIDRRITNVRLRPDSYWAYVRDWRIAPDRLIARDRLVR